MATEKKAVQGYLPNDRPPIGKLILLGLQHVLTMFPATVFVAAFTGFHVGTVLFASGISTIVALVLSKNRIGTFIPLFYGSSFSYIAAYLGIAVLMTGDVPAFGVPLPPEVISTMQAGIVVTGILNIIVGFVIRVVGKGVVDKVLPPVVTGSVAAIIGFSLALAALNLASESWGIALVVLFVTVLFSVYLQGRGFIGMLPILLGAIFGFVLAAVLEPSSVNMTAVREAPLIVNPLENITFPTFTGAFVVTAIVSISIMAIATIPESTAHLYQISLYVDRFADEVHRERSHLDQAIGWNLVFDGIGDFINGLLGATAGTNYGENNSLMAITRNYSGPALIMAGVFSILLAFSGTLVALVAAVPLAVTGGLSVYLFGVIGMQGIALMQEHRVSMFDPRNLAVGATIMVVGIGGHIGFGGFIPITLGQVFPSGLPAIALAAVLGILMNLIFVVFTPPEGAQIAETATAAAD